jgi:2-furoyl-CoA dehydrogenase large subunit
VPVERIAYKDGTAFDTAAPDKKRTWTELVTIGHRYIHRLPPGMEPGLSVSHIMPVPTGGGLPDAQGRVQMYPCYAFEFHLMLMTIDPDLGKTEIRRYVVGHDCGTVINPKIVRGMTMGGIAHGIGAALYEEFAYNADGLLMAQSFMDYLLPSSHEVPPVEIVEHETPSPLTVFGQKGSGESGYLGAPAAVASAINDAIRPLGICVNSLPIKVARLGDMIAQARGNL